MAGDGARYEPGRPGAWVEPVRTAVAGTRFADVRWCAETGSTNADALELARNGAGEGIVLVADYQRAGRGRRARSWVAPPGGSLLVSVLLRPPAPVAGAATMTVAVALAEAMEEATGVTARLKWPNDLVVDDRKLAGILAEADWPAGANISAGWREPPAHARVPVVVGTGVNVAWPAVLPPELEAVADTATALSRVVDGVAEDAAGTDDLRGRVLAGYLRRLDRRYGELVSDGSAGILAAWRERSATLGRRVRVDLGSDDVEGTAVDVTDEGHLVVQSLTGERRALAVGDVVHLRPAEGGPRTP